MKFPLYAPTGISSFHPKGPDLKKNKKNKNFLFNNPTSNPPGQHAASLLILMRKDGPISPTAHGLILFFFLLSFVHKTDIRTQLNEQLRCLDYRMETQISVVGELQDFFRRRAEVELDYSKNLDKLSKSLSARHKEQKQK